jgi:hypothetical protein
MKKILTIGLLSMSLQVFALSGGVLTKAVETAFKNPAADILTRKMVGKSTKNLPLETRIKILEDAALKLSPADQKAFVESLGRLDAAYAKGNKEFKKALQEEGAVMDRLAKASRLSDNGEVALAAKKDSGKFTNDMPTATVARKMEAPAKEEKVAVKAKASKDASKMTTESNELVAAFKEMASRDSGLNLKMALASVKVNDSIIKATKESLYNLSEIAKCAKEGSIRGSYMNTLTELVIATKGAKTTKAVCGQLKNAIQKTFGGTRKEAVTRAEKLSGGKAGKGENACSVLNPSLAVGC